MRFYPCRYCGGTVAYMKQRISGEYDFKINIDGTEADNSGIHDDLTYKGKWKYYRCVVCDTRMTSIAQYNLKSRFR